MALQSKIDELTQRTSLLKSEDLDADFRSWVKCIKELEEIQSNQTRRKKPQVPKSESTATLQTNFKNLHKWLQSHGVDMSNVDFGTFTEGNGLVALKDIKEGEPFLNIPLKLMMTYNSALEGELKELLANDQLAKTVPSVAVALHVLHEKQKLNGNCKEILPETFSTPLFWTLEELELLKGSPALTDFIKVYRNYVQEYIYFYKRLKALDTESPIPVTKFHIQDFFWAVSVLSTRQNMIPVDEKTVQVALIPIWDMCNHTDGKITTYYDLPTQMCESRAVKDFKKGEQVYMYYGNRPNIELLIYAGFVYPNNKNDCVRFKVEVPKDDPLCNEKQDLLQKLALKKFFAVQKTISPELLACYRVIAMTKVDLSNQHYESTIAKGAISEENEKLALHLLTKALQSMLEGYSTDIETDKKLLQSAKTFHEKCAIMLRMCEKQILQQAIQSLASNPKKNKKKKKNTNKAKTNETKEEEEKKQ